MAYKKARTDQYSVSLLQNNNFIDTCRLCLKDRKKMLDLFQPERNFVEKIHFCTGIRISEDPKLSSAICCKCDYELTVAHKFKTTCLNTLDVFETLSADADNEEKFIVKIDSIADNEPPIIIKTNMNLKYPSDNIDLDDVIQSIGLGGNNIDADNDSHDVKDDDNNDGYYMIDDKNIMLNNDTIKYNKYKIIYDDNDTIKDDKYLIKHTNNTIDDNDKMKDNKDILQENDDVVEDSNDAVEDNNEYKYILDDEDDMLHDEDDIRLDAKDDMLHNEDYILHDKDNMLHDKDDMLHDKDDMLHDEDDMSDDNKDIIINDGDPESLIIIKRQKSIEKGENGKVSKKTKVVLVTERYCAACDRSFESARKFKAHRLVYHSGERHICDICGRSLKHIASFNSHMKKHFTTPKNMCDQCDYQAYTTTDLHKHMRVHTGEKNYICSFCSARFRWPTSLTSHENVMHRKEKKHCCTRCGAAFYTRHNLNMHMDSHDNIKRYECEVCHMSLSRRCHWKAHLKTVHDIDTPKSRRGKSRT